MTELGALGEVILDRSYPSFMSREFSLFIKPYRFSIIPIIQLFGLTRFHPHSKPRRFSQRNTRRLSPAQFFQNKFNCRPKSPQLTSLITKVLSSFHTISKSKSYQRSPNPAPPTIQPRQKPLKTASIPILSRLSRPAISPLRTTKMAFSSTIATRLLILSQSPSPKSSIVLGFWCGRWKDLVFREIRGCA